MVTTEVESRTQGSWPRPRTQGSRPRPRTQKNPRPRPRTALRLTDPLEAKNRNAPGQGQGPRTQAHVFSKKKGLQKKFSGDLLFIGVPRIFVGGGLNHRLHAMTLSNFPKREFLWYKDIVGWKI